MGVGHIWRGSPNIVCLQGLWKKLPCFVLSFEFSMFSPHGARLQNGWVQLSSTLFLMITTCSLRGGFFMNSKIVMVACIREVSTHWLLLSQVIYVPIRLIWSERQVETNIWMAWFAWLLILGKDAKCVLCKSICLETTVDVQGMGSLCILYAVSSAVWGISTLEVCLEWYPFQDVSWELLLAGGEGF